MINKLGLDAARKWSENLKREGKDVTLFEAGSFMCGFNAAIAMLYAEVKPEELVNGKVYLVAYAMLADWYPAVACGSARIEISGKKYYAKQFAYIRGPILQPSEVLDD